MVIDSTNKALSMASETVDAVQKFDDNLQKVRP